VNPQSVVVGPAELPSPGAGASAIDLDLHHDRYGGAITLGEGDAFAFAERRPARLLGHGLHHRGVARLGEVAQAESDRIRAGGVRQLVNELLGAEMDFRAYRIAEVRGAQRRAVLDELRDRLPAEQLVLET